MVRSHRDAMYSGTLFFAKPSNHQTNRFKVFGDDYQKYNIVVHKKQHWQNLNLKVIGIGIST